MIDSLEDAKQLVEAEYEDSWPPITTDPKVNFLIDQALNMGPEDWEDVKKEYEEEVEHLSDSENVNLVDPEELTMNREDHWCKGFKLWGTKALELERIPTDDGDGEMKRILQYGLSVRIKRRMDHAGITFLFNTPAGEYRCAFYDVRHWDYDEDEWKPLPED